QDVVGFIRSLEKSPKIGAYLSARVTVETSAKYAVIHDYFLFYEIEKDTAKVLRLLTAKSNWMNAILNDL
ncbi:type II toxin-antitoxin system RelE/ParE family toxin, partial [Enterococcus faecalis]|uniref:type II toxin-antitoxin system RelE/ParE family toxin n=1 Tax=Enterococcus faecalis TaxID=1351 RepID=UPI003CC5C90E